MLFLCNNRIECFIVWNETDITPGDPFSDPKSVGKNNPSRGNRKTHWRRWCKAIFPLWSSLRNGEEGTTLANVNMTSVLHVVTNCIKILMIFLLLIKSTISQTRMRWRTVVLYFYVVLYAFPSSSLISLCRASTLAAGWRTSQGANHQWHSTCRPACAKQRGVSQQSAQPRATKRRQNAWGTLSPAAQQRKLNPKAWNDEFWSKSILC